MRTHFFLVLLSLCSCLASFGQQDSLHLRLSQANDDPGRIAALNDLAGFYKSSDPAKMAKYANQALDLSKKIKDPLAQGTALIHLGNSQILSGRYDKALDYFLSAQKILEAQNQIGNRETKSLLAKTLGSLGVVFSEQSNYSRALQFHLKAISIYETLDDAATLAKVYNNAGICYQSLQQEYKALTYFLKAQKIQARLNDPSAGFTTTNIGNCYLKRGNLDKAFSYYRQALLQFEKHPDARGKGELLNNLGEAYNQSGSGQKAVESWKAALAAFKTIDDKFGTADTFALLASYYSLKKDYETAFSFANQSLELANQLEILEQIAIAEKLLSDIEIKRRNFESAHMHLLAYSAAKDSLISHEKIRNAVLADVNFELDKREARNRLDREKRELLFAESQKRHTQQLLFTGLVLLLICGLLFAFYSRSQLKKRLTLQKELAEYEQKALHLQMNPHFVFNCLGSISSFIVQNGSDSAIKYLSKFSKLMRLTLEYSKESLIPIDKEIEGLQNYLELEQLRFNGIFDFIITKSPEVEDDIALPPLLLQPFVENAIIHGIVPKKSQGKIGVSFELDSENLVCVVDDDGIGFEHSQAIRKQSVPLHKSMALDITRKRLEMIKAFTSRKADVSIDEKWSDNGISLGTRVVLRLPIQYINPNSNSQ